MNITSLFLAFLLFAGANASGACSTLDRPEPKDEDLYAKATSVFVAKVVRTEEVIGPYGPQRENVPIVEGTFEVTELLKGQPPTDRKVRDFVFGPGNCSLGLFAGLHYLFFLQPGQDNFVLWPTGSRGFVNINGAEPKKVLTKLRALKAEQKQ